MAKKRKEHHEEHPDERWLLTYADLITLLVALFIVMFAMSSVNQGKFDKLAKSLSDTLSGGVVQGGTAMAEAGSSVKDPSPVEVPFAPAVRPQFGGGETAVKGGDGEAKKRQERRSKEEEGFKALKERIDGYARDKGLDGRVKTRVTEDGLQVRVLTDGLLFDSGSAEPKLAGRPLVEHIGTVLAGAGEHPVTVSGHTDPEPIATGRFRSNWDLSVARATSVVSLLTQADVPAQRLTAAGRAQLDPVADNDTPAGRALNRRVEILLPRLAT